MKGVDDDYFFQLKKSLTNLYELSKFIKFCESNKIQKTITSLKNSSKPLEFFTSVEKPLPENFSDSLFVPFNPALAQSSHYLLYLIF